MAIYPPNTTSPKKGLNYVWNFLGSSLKTLANALQPYLDGGVPYKSYVALLSQTGTNPPVATVLENTLGDITWTYNNSGDYRGYFSFSIVQSKTTITSSQSGDVGIYGITYTYIYPGEAYVTTQNLSNVFSNDVLYNTMIEIRVYP